MELRHKIDELLENWPVKLICFGVALMSCALFRISQFKSTTLTVPIHIISNKAMCISGRTDFIVRVTVRSTTENIANITDKNINATADISRFTQNGSYDVPVYASLVGSLQALEPVEVKVMPEHINITLEKTALSYVPIKPLFSGEVAHGYENLSYSASPDTVLVSGPETIVNDMKYINTEKVDIKGAKSNITRNVALLNINNHVKLEDAKSASVTVHITAKQVNRYYSARAIEIKNLNKRFVVTSVIPKIDFELKGNLLALEALDTKDKVASVDCQVINAAGVYNLPVVLDKVAGTTVVSRSIEKVALTVQENYIYKEVPKEIPPPAVE